MLTAGLSTTTVACEVNVYFTAISCFQCGFPRILQNIRSASPVQTCNRNSSEPPHAACSTARLSESSHPDSWCDSWSAQTVRIYFRVVHLNAHLPKWNLNQTAVCCHNLLEWANARLCHRVAFYCDHPTALLYNNHTVSVCMPDMWGLVLCGLSWQRTSAHQTTPTLIFVLKIWE